MICSSAKLKYFAVSDHELKRAEIISLEVSEMNVAPYRTRLSGREAYSDVTTFVAKCPQLSQGISLLTPSRVRNYIEVLPGELLHMTMMICTTYNVL